MALALTPLLGEEARGMLWLAHDLRSLVALSKSIVLAKEVSSRSAWTGMDFKTFVVEEVYKGPLLPGMEVSVFDWYRRSDWLGNTLSFDPEVILFLEDWDPKAQALSGQTTNDRPTHSILDSGLRLLNEKRVYDFVQSSNPGPIVPHLLKWRSKEAAEGDVAFNEGLPVTLEVYEKEILHEILIVEAIRQALSKSQDVRFREALLRIIEKAYSRDAAWRRKCRADGVGTHDRGNAFMWQVVDRFRAAGDIEGILEVMQRTELYELRIDAKPLLDAAERQSLPTRLRITALLALDIWFTPETETLSRVAEITSDSDPDVGRAALERLKFAHRGYAKNPQNHAQELTDFGEKLLARFPKLKDPEPPPHWAKKSKEEAPK